MRLRAFITILLIVFVAATCRADADNYKNSQEYLTLRDSMRHSFNAGDSTRFFIAVKNLEDYTLKQNDLHEYYTQRCNEIVFLMNRQKIFEAYKLAKQLSKELRERKLDKEMYMAVNMQGHINRYCGNKVAAKKCFYQVLDMMEKEGYYESMPPIYMNIVDVEMSDNPDEAVRLLDKAAEIARKSSPDRVFDIETRRTLSYYTRGNIQQFLEGYDAYKEGVKQGKSSVHGRTMEIYHEAAIGNTDKAVEMAIKELGEDAQNNITQIYENAGRWEEAYLALKQVKELNDSVDNVVLSNSMQGIRDELMLYDAEREAARNQLFALLACIGLLLALVIALVYIVNSRRRHLKQLKQAYERALESDKMKMAFIQNISHEVRTPLNILNGFAQVIASPEQDTSLEDRKTIASTITHNSHLITNLIDEMLELSSNETSATTSKLDTVICNKLFREELKQFETETRPGVELRLDSSLPDDFTLQTNENMLCRIINVLLDNAVKNTQKGSITLKASKTEEQLTIVVEDTGCGVPKGEAEHIFERFVKLDTFKEGVGLGLPLCRSMAQRLGGNVHIDTSYASPGARFVVTLPIGE